MHRRDLLTYFLVLGPLAGLFAATPQGKQAAADTWSPPSSLHELPITEGLPQVFTFDDGSKVRTLEDWERRREELKAIMLYYQYGSMPPRPDGVTVVESMRRPHDSGLGTMEFLTLEIDSVKKLRFRAVFYLPKHPGRRPVIIREEDRIGHRKDVPMFLEKGYIFVEYARHDLDPDRDRVVGTAQAAYPDHDWATLAVWAWCGMRLVDYLETRDEVDATRIGITGHSRGGKMALLTAALDERISLVVPHQSGSGGAGCYRVLSPGAETLAHNDKPHWYHERIRWFREMEERLPFDQHFLKALVAPRALLCTESIDDEFANPLGSLVTSVAAQEVFEFLGRPRRMAFTFVVAGTPPRPRIGPVFSSSPSGTSSESRQRIDRSIGVRHFLSRPGFDSWTSERNLFASKGVDRQPDKFIDPHARHVEAEFKTVGLPGNSPDRDLHGQGRFGAVDETFQIAVNQVTQLEYARFLNAVAAEDPAGLYHPVMANGPGAIRREAVESEYRYQVLEGEAPTPVTHVSWFDAVRYCNWLHHGQPNGPQGPVTTEDGAYALHGPRQAGPRQRGAKFFLPTQDEWYKAAYYAPQPHGGSSYRHFAPLESNRPMVDKPQPDLVSPWGMAGFADHVWVWTESPVGKLHRGLRSGAWFLGNNKQAAGHFYSNPQIEHLSIGFRVAKPSAE